MCLHSPFRHLQIRLKNVEPQRTPIRLPSVAQGRLRKHEGTRPRHWPQIYADRTHHKFLAFISVHSVAQFVRARDAVITPREVEPLSFRGSASHGASRDEWERGTPRRLKITNAASGSFHDALIVTNIPAQELPENAFHHHGRCGAVSGPSHSSSVPFAKLMVLRSWSGCQW